MAALCAAKNKDGSACKVRATRVDMCVFHDPALEQTRRDGSRRGGKGKSKRARAERTVVTYGAKDAQTILSTALRDVVARTLDVGTGVAIASMCRALVVIADEAETAAKIAELQARLDAQAKDTP